MTKALQSELDSEIKQNVTKSVYTFFQGLAEDKKDANRKIIFSLSKANLIPQLDLLLTSQEKSLTQYKAYRAIVSSTLTADELKLFIEVSKPILKCFSGHESGAWLREIAQILNAKGQANVFENIERVVREEKFFLNPENIQSYRNADVSQMPIDFQNFLEVRTQLIQNLSENLPTFKSFKDNTMVLHLGIYKVRKDLSVEDFMVFAQNFKSELAANEQDYNIASFLYQHIPIIYCLYKCLFFNHCCLAEAHQFLDESLMLLSQQAANTL